MHTDFAVLADAASIDSTGKLSILGIFDRITAAEFPARHERMTLVFRLVATPEEVGEHQVRITVSSPSDERLANLEGALQIGPAYGGDAIRMPQVVHMDGFVFPEAGRYSIDVAVDGEVVVSVGLVLNSTAGMAMA